MKKIFLVLLISIVTIEGFSQEKKTREQKKQERKDRINQLAKQQEEGALVYNKQGAFGIKLNTDGYGVFYEHGRYKTVTNTFLWWAELGERKNSKEERKTPTSVQGPFVVLGNPVIYGKINNFYYLKLGIGQQTLIGGKGNKNGVAVSLIYGGGFSAGLLKPYYLTIQDSTDQTRDVRYSDSTALYFKDPSYIVGSAGLFKGWGNIKFVPGIHARAALRFDYGRFNELLSAIETGVTAEYYTQSMPIMFDIPAKKFFFNAYVSLVFGKRK